MERERSTAGTITLCAQLLHEGLDKLEQRAREELGRAVTADEQIKAF